MYCKVCNRRNATPFKLDGSVPLQGILCNFPSDTLLLIAQGNIPDDIKGIWQLKWNLLVNEIIGLMYAVLLDLYFGTNVHFGTMLKFGMNLVNLTSGYNGIFFTNLNIF